MTALLSEHSVTSLDVVHHADALAWLRGAPSNWLNCVVTSPPYYWQRDYDNGLRQLGHEDTPGQYVARLRSIFRELQRVLRGDGVFYLNIGDTYYSGKGQPHGRDDRSPARNFSRKLYRAVDRPGWTLPKKSQIGIPWMVARALQRDGWILRSSIVWFRPGAFVGVSVKDRPAQKYEMLFMFTKTGRYYYAPEYLDGDGDVWIFDHTSVSGHSAPFPPELAERCILTGCPDVGIVYDPFIGSGTSALVAQRLGRHFVGTDINREYVELARTRLRYRGDDRRMVREQEAGVEQLSLLDTEAA